MQTQVVFLKADSKLHAKPLMTLMTLTLMTGKRKFSILIFLR